MLAIPGSTDAERLDYIRAHRTEFMGKVLIGVLTTGIYCLPTCPARQPKAENVRLFRTEAEAQAAGLRACKRCRPDFFYRNYDPDYECLIALIDQMRREPGSINSLTDMVNQSGIGVTKLNALFRRHFHSTPAAYLSRVRIAAACEVLSDPARQIIDAAYTAGYESLSPFYENFRRATGLSPKDYQQPGSKNQFTITLPQNYLPSVTLRLLDRDSASVIERVSGNCAVKALHINGTPLLLHMQWDDGQVHCRVESEQTVSVETMQAVHSAVIRMLGFWTNPAGFEHCAESDPDVARLVGARQGLRIPLSADIFEGIAWAIIGQQINLPFAYKLRREFAQHYGQPLGNGMFAHPTPEQVAQLDYEDLTPYQFSRRKAEYLIDIARLIVSGELALDPLAAATSIEKRLLAVRGIGVWSVNYIMMRAFGFVDCVPLGDTGLTSALQRFYRCEQRPDATETTRLMQKFAPYRSLATYHLWMSQGENPA